MDSQVDGVFKKMVSLLQLMKQTGSADPSNPKIALELQKYERELYLNLRDYGGLLRKYLQMDKEAAEDDMFRGAELARLRKELEDDDDFDLSWDAPSSVERTIESAPKRAVSQDIPTLSAPPAQPQGNPTRPLPPRASAEDRPGVRPRSASEILSQLHGTSAEGV